MKPDLCFPPPPQFRQPPLRCDDIPPARQRAIQRQGRIADEAEKCVGMSLEAAPFAGNGLSLVQYCARGSRFLAELMELLVRGARVPKDAADALPGVMLINARDYWGRIGPMRGDVVIFADGHVSVVVQPLCMGCQHFEAVTFAEDPPAIAKVTQWHSAVKWIVRVVDESPEEAEPLAVAEGGSPEASEAGQAGGPPHERPKRRTGVK